ncbi:MAG TPA: electron transfer flavoprotein subunit beta/FixA family protein [Candidatus Edwardsbacteria bacterium]|nr:electron transfer flavoprotein subunit beta/FixA family protein [Candidatus Edwardsbacteria bacterium]
MNIIVCIKQVPDTTDVRIDPATNTLVREGVPSIINPFDMYAIEEGLRLREKLGGKVTVLSMGPPQVAAALKEAISMGVDEAVLLSDRAFAGADTWATSYTLALGIRKLGGYGLVLCGKQAIDGDTAQVGPGIAEFLDIPQVTYVKKVETIDERGATAWRMTEDGYEVVKTSLPAVLTVVKEINEPRLPSLKGKMRAKSYQPTVWKASDLGADEQSTGLNGSPTNVVKIFTPPVKTGGIVLTGDVNEAVAAVVEGLKERQLI